MSATSDLVPSVPASAGSLCSILGVQRCLLAASWRSIQWMMACSSFGQGGFVWELFSRQLNYNFGYFLHARRWSLPTSLAKAKMTTNHFVLVRLGLNGQGFFCFGAQRQPMFLYNPS